MLLDLNAQSKQYSVLLVQKDQAQAELAYTFLEELSLFRVCIRASDSSQVLQKAINQRFDLVISDFDLQKGGTAEKIFGDLRRMKSNGNIKFLVLYDASHQSRIPNFASYKSAVHFLKRPFTEDEFKSLVRTLIEEKEQPPAPAKSHTAESTKQRSETDLQYFVRLLPEDSKKFRILIVDDIGVMRNLVQKLLNDEGYENIILAENGVEALEEVVHGYKNGAPIQLVLSDWNMPEVNGYELLKALRRKQEFKHLPFFMVSSETRDQYVKAALEAGATEFIGKPFKTQLLVEKVPLLPIFQKRQKR